MTSGVSRDGDYVVIRIPATDVHTLRIALNCPCKSTKSAATETYRKRLDRALAPFMRVQR